MRHKAKNPYREIRALGLVAATWSVDTPSMRFDEARPLNKGSDSHLFCYYWVTNPVVGRIITYLPQPVSIGSSKVL